MLEFLQMAPPPKWPSVFIHIQYDPRQLSLLQHQQQKLSQSSCLVGSCDPYVDRTQKIIIKPVPRQTPGRGVLRASCTAAQRTRSSLKRVVIS